MFAGLPDDVTRNFGMVHTCLGPHAQPMPRAHATPGHRALRRGRHSRDGGIYHITTVTRSRNPLFEDFPAACSACAAISSAPSLGTASLLAWVLMPDHMHLLLQLDGEECLSKVVARLKSRSAKAFQQASGRCGAVWAPGFHDRALRRDDDVRHVARYIVANPVRAGLVARCGDYPFWDAVWL